MNTQLNNRDYMYKLIEDKALCDDNIYIVCSDGLDNIIFPKFKKQIPDRIISCGISEQNQISVATGLALGGKRVYCVMLSTFMLHRALDQFKMACYSNANIKFIAFDSGIEEMKAGYSHIAPDDFAILKSTPNLKIYSPSTLNEVEKVVNKTFTENYPVYISADRVDSGLKTTEIDKEVIKDCLLALPERKHFDTEFKTVPSSIENKRTKKYKIADGVELMIKSTSNDFSSRIISTMKNGKRVLEIVCDDDETYNAFIEENA